MSGPVTPSPFMRIYSDDPLLKFKDTEIPPLRTKHDIDAVLAEYEVKEVYWKWDAKAIENNLPADVSVMFKIEEPINGILVRVPAEVNCYLIWDRANKLARRPERRVEKVNWRISMRVMYHFIYTHLNTTYAMQSSKVVAFLGYVKNIDGKQLKDVLLPKLKEYAALEFQKVETNGSKP